MPTRTQVKDLVSECGEVSDASSMSSDDSVDSDNSESYIEIEMCGQSMSVDPSVQADDANGQGNWEFDSFSAHGSKYHEGLRGTMRSMDTIELEYSPHNIDLLLRTQMESEVILARVRKQLHISSEDSISPFQAMQVCIPPLYIDTFLEWLNNDTSSKFSRRDIHMFIEVEILCRTANRSSTFVCKGVPDDASNAYRRVRSAMRKASKNNREKTNHQKTSRNLPFTADKYLKRMQDLASRHWNSLLFVNGVTWVDLDDDKLPHSSSDFESAGIRLIPTKTQKRKPVVHVVASVGTGVILQGWVEFLRTKVSDIVKKSVNLMLEHPDDLGKESCSRDLTIFIDREYLAIAKYQQENTRTNIIQILQDLNVSFLGTCKQTRMFPFQDLLEKPTRQSSTQSAIIWVNGRRSAHTAKVDGENLYALTSRHGQGKARIARLVTNNPKLGVHNWVFEVGYGQVQKNHPGGVSRLEHVVADHEPLTAESSNEARISAAFRNLESRTIRLTQKQGTADWFLARLFRATSTTSFQCMNFVSAPFIHSEELRTMHAHVLQIAVLNPVTAITVENASERVDPDLPGSLQQSRMKRRRVSHGDKTKAQYWLNKCKTRVNLAAELMELTGEVVLPEEKNLDIAERLASATALKIVSTQSSVADSLSIQNLSQHENLQHTPVGCSDTSSEISFYQRQQCFLQTLMLLWFIPPWRDGLAPHKSPLRLGKENENVITAGLKTFIYKVSSKNIKIHEIRPYGLLANRDVPFIADSPDGVAVISRKVGDEYVIQDATALEFKTVTSPDTISAVAARVGELGQFVECHAGSLLFKHAVPEPSYRAQIIHHACALDVSEVLLIYSTSERELQAVLVEVAQAQRDQWRGYLGALADEYMKFAYGEHLGTFPRLGNDYSSSYGFAREHHTVDVYLQLWRRHNDDVLSNGTPPPCKKILPKLCSVWNHHMGNVDIVRKTVEGRKRRTSRLKPAALVWLTYLDYTLYNAFRVYQLARLEAFTPHAKSFDAWQTARKNTTSFVVFLEDLHRGMCYRFDENNQFPLSLNCDIVAANPNSAIESSPQNDEDSSKYVTKSVLLNLLQGLKNNTNNEHTLSRNQPYGTPPARRTCILCCVRCEKSQDHVSRRGRSTTKECKGCEIHPGQYAALCKKCFDTFHELGAKSISNVHFSFLKEL